MPENTIKPSEVSEVLLQQLQGIDTSLKFDEVGTVLQVSDGVARIYGLRNAEANELQVASQQPLRQLKLPLPFLLNSRRTTMSMALSVLATSLSESVGSRNAAARPDFTSSAPLRASFTGSN